MLATGVPLGMSAEVLAGGAACDPLPTRPKYSATAMIEITKTLTVVDLVFILFLLTALFDLS
jgi:hypothetical protein